MQFGQAVKWRIRLLNEFNLFKLQVFLMNFTAHYEATQICDAMATESE